MKWREQVRELKDMSVDGLKTKEREFSEELFWLKMKHRSGQLPNFASIAKVKKNLARVKTFLHAKLLTMKPESKEGRDEKKGN